MVTSSRTLTVVIVILVAALLVTATFAAYYLVQYQQAENNANAYESELKTAQPTQETNFLLDFGNGSSFWANTTVPTGTNGYIATVIITHGVVNATWYAAPYNEHFVNGIDNVQNSATQSWFLWTYNSTARWQVAQVGADDLTVTNGSIFAWTYCSFNPTTYAPSCTP